jgi:altronate dehydratase large subunit
MPDDMDLDAGTVISRGARIEDVGAELLELIVRTASGEVTAAERNGHREFAIHRIGPTV